MLRVSGSGLRIARRRIASGRRFGLSVGFSVSRGDKGFEGSDDLGSQAERSGLGFNVQGSGFIASATYVWVHLQKFPGDSTRNEPSQLSGIPDSKP